MADEDRSLIPTIDVPDFEEDSDEYDVEYRPSLAWDLEAGDFVRDGSNRVPMNDGLTAYQVWCVKTVATERYECLAYSDDLGTEMVDASQEEDLDAVELAIERTIEEALLVNPRTLSVEDFEFEWNGSEVHVTFTVEATGEETFTLDATIDT